MTADVPADGRLIRAVSAADGSVLRLPPELLLAEAERVRYEMLREVNGLPEASSFGRAFQQATARFFRDGAQLSVLAMDGSRAAGCATICWLSLMPTYDHPSGSRAHLMNVYVRKEFRRRGIARGLVALLLEEARARGVTEISLDATESGRPLYESLGFLPNREGMALRLS